MRNGRNTINYIANDIRVGSQTPIIQANEAKRNHFSHKWNTSTRLFKPKKYIKATAYECFNPFEWSAWFRANQVNIVTKQASPTKRNGHGLHVAILYDMATAFGMHNPKIPLYFFRQWTIISHCSRAFHHPKVASTGTQLSTTIIEIFHFFYHFTRIVLSVYCELHAFRMQLFNYSGIVAL